MAYPTDPIYKLVITGIGATEPNAVEKMDLNYRVIIPFNEENTHYQEYLSWVAVGNTAEPADSIKV